MVLNLYELFVRKNDLTGHLEISLISQLRNAQIIVPTRFRRSTIFLKLWQEKFNISITLRSTGDKIAHFTKERQKTRISKIKSTTHLIAQLQM
jgi:hypothetical protein